MNASSSLSLAIVGSGPAGLMAAERAAQLAAAQGVALAVTVYDAMPSPARKFLMAGRGGLNLTHSEGPPGFFTRYGAARDAMQPLIEDFHPDALRDWSHGLGQDTFVGSSGRVFPRAMKASPLLRAWLRRLEGLGVRLALRHRWTGWREDGVLSFATLDGPVDVAADAVVLALGGASWPRLGSDGGWVSLLTAAGVAVRPLQPANMGLVIPWTHHVAERFAGEPLKSITLSLGSEWVRGEAVITRAGLEGQAVYALSAQVRDALAATGEVVIHLDLKPDVAAAFLAERLARSRPGESLSNRLRKAAGLGPAAIAVLRDGSAGALPSDPAALAGLIKAVPLRVTGTQGLDRAISSAGGVAWEAVDDRLMLRARPGTFVAGEMLDWEAPTGGYLLQGCLATGQRAGEGALRWLVQTAV